MWGKELSKHAVYLPINEGLQRPNRRQVARTAGQPLQLAVVKLGALRNAAANERASPSS